MVKEGEIKEQCVAMLDAMNGVADFVCQSVAVAQHEYPFEGAIAALTSMQSCVLSLCAMLRLWG